jgi:predicted CXXCH cytochrome family protein
MKRLLIVLLAMVFMVGFAGIASAASGDIDGSKHDFSATGAAGTFQDANTTGEICNTCHAPHNPVAASDGPLWDHTVTSESFTGYTSPNDTIDATDVNDTIGAVSKLCLSCHDGSVAVDAFGGGGGTATLKLTSGSAYLSNDLSDDHPISFTYATSISGGDTEIEAEATVETAGLPMFGSGQMECATCHNAHDGTATYFLRIDNDQSDLCQTCHLK